MSELSTRLRHAVRELRPRGGAWLIIAGACVAGALLFVLLWLSRADTSTDASDDADLGTRNAAGVPAPLPAPLPATAGNASGIDYPDTPPARSLPPAPAPAMPPQPAPVPSTGTAHVETADTVPRPVSTPGPTYPRASLRRGESGEVLLRVHVDARGRTSAVDIVRSSQFNRLDQAAVAAVRRWRFEPAMRDGQAVAGQVQVPVDFAPAVR